MTQFQWGASLSVVEYMTLRGGGPQRVLTMLTLRDMYLTVDSVVKIGEK